MLTYLHTSIHDIHGIDVFQTFRWVRVLTETARTSGNG